MYAPPWRRLASGGVRVHCLALGGVDLTSSAGKMTMQVLSAVAEFERDLLIERTQAGIKRAKEQGKRFGRPPALAGVRRQLALEKIQAGVPIATIARERNVSRQSLIRLRAHEAKLIPVQGQRPVRKPGALKGKMQIADDFDAPLPDV